MVKTVGGDPVVPDPDRPFFCGPASAGLIDPGKHRCRLEQVPCHDIASLP
jgi:hypothetical protein